MSPVSYMKLLFSLYFIFQSTHGLCHSEHQHKVTNAHSHGTADLTLAIEGEHLEIELHSPAINLLGFESKANTDIKRRTLETAKLKLQAANSQFSFVGAPCELLEHKADFSSVELSISELSNTLNSSEITIPNGHSDISVLYHFRCDNILKLEEIVTRLASTFTNLEKINVRWARENKQGALILNRNDKSITFN